ncbi:MAG: hypothetical protein V3S56_07515 [Gemmatimonadota bacterium]
MSPNSATIPVVDDEPSRDPIRRARRIISQHLSQPGNPVELTSSAGAIAEQKRHVDVNQVDATDIRVLGNASLPARPEPHLHSRIPSQALESVPDPGRIPGARVQLRLGTERSESHDATELECSAWQEIRLLRDQFIRGTDETGGKTQ